MCHRNICKLQGWMAIQYFKCCTLFLPELLSANGDEFIHLSWPTLPNNFSTSRMVEPFHIFKMS